MTKMKTKNLKTAKPTNPCLVASYAEKSRYCYNKCMM